MMPPMVVPVYHGPTFEQRAQSAAFNYSSDPKVQEGFMAGAKWGNASEVSGFSLFLAVVLISYIFGNLAGFVGGSMDSDSDRVEVFNTPAKIIFPGYAAGYYVVRFMSRSIK